MLVSILGSPYFVKLPCVQVYFYVSLALDIKNPLFTLVFSLARSLKKKNNRDPACHLQIRRLQISRIMHPR